MSDHRVGSVAWASRYGPATPRVGDTRQADVVKNQITTKTKLWLVVLDIVKRVAFNRFTSKTTRLWVEIQVNSLLKKLKSCRRAHIVRNPLL
jgi:hypothetical protein